MKRAPSGSRQLVDRAARLIRSVGIERAASALGISERKAREVRRVAETGAPVRRVITGTTSRENWASRIKTGRANIRAERTADRLLGRFTRTEIVTAREGSERETSAALKRAEHERGTIEDARLLTSLERNELKLDEDERKAIDAGWLFYKSPAACLKEHKQAIIASRPFADVDDAIEKLKAISKEYFAIVRVPRGEKTDYVLYDIRTNKQRQKHNRTRRNRTKGDE